MRKSLMLAAALAMATAPGLGSMPPDVQELIQTGTLTVRRRRSKTASKLNHFWGYASDRKGKGQKKREASARHARGWQ
jgi:hypothetical protein